MKAPYIDKLVEELNQKFGDRSFYTLRQLTTIGFFGSLPAARLALKEKRLKYVKVSPRRTLIPRSSVLDYIHRNLIEDEIEETSKGYNDNP